jgi:hypothetical protein
MTLSAGAGSGAPAAGPETAMPKPVPRATTRAVANFERMIMTVS